MSSRGIGDDDWQQVGDAVAPLTKTVIFYAALDGIIERDRASELLAELELINV